MTNAPTKPTPRSSWPAQVPIHRTPPARPAGVSRSTRRARLAARAGDLDRLASDALRPVALPTLRVLLGLVFIWFGGLKVAGLSPVKALVAGTLPWADPDVVVPLLGGVEIGLGLALVLGVLLRFVLPVLAVHLLGTFLTFFMLPGQMFRGSDPLLLTESGEFVMKNLVLISAALVLIAHSSRRRTDYS